MPASTKSFRRPNRQQDSVSLEAARPVEPADSVSGAEPNHQGCESLTAITALPRDVGWYLLIGGLLSELGAPGVPPFWIIGAMILWPRFGMRVGATLQRRAPSLFEGCIAMVSRYSRDLAQRYPQRR